MTELNILNEKPTSNEDVYRLLVRIHRLAQKVRAFVSMTRSISSIQRYVQERIDSNKGGFILDVQVRFNCYLFFCTSFRLKIQ